MYCPDCGHDAEDANFCPECGADLRGPAAAPACEDCGTEVPDGARFCPECGAPAGAATADAAPVATPAAGRRTGTRGRSSGAARRQQRPARPAPGKPAPEKTAGSPSRLSPAVIWGGLGVAAVVIVLIVVFVTTGGGDATGAAPTGGTQSVQPVAADTSGSYGELVERGNGLYDQGAAAFDSQQYDQGAAYFAAAARVYAAAWKQQSADPGVGTDYATSLFYSGQIDPAIEQVEQVLAKTPTFQTGWFNKGDYLAEKARLAEQDGSAKVAKAAYADARAAYEKAVSLGAESASGQQAQQRLDALPQ
jgi:hypothetical protein